MTNEESIERLIETACQLQDQHYQSPKIGLWEARVKRFIEKYYSLEEWTVFQQALSFGWMINSDEHGQQMHVEAIARAIEFLEGLREMPQSEYGQAASKTTSHNRLGRETSTSTGGNRHTTHVYGGMVAIGDNNQMSQVTVGSFLDALKKEVADSKVIPEKDTTEITGWIGKITSNPTFSSIANTAVAAILGRL